jgi:hypothetical protein
MSILVARILISGIVGGAVGGAFVIVRHFA